MKCIPGRLEPNLIPIFLYYTFLFTKLVECLNSYTGMEAAACPLRLLIFAFQPFQERERERKGNKIRDKEEEIRSRTEGKSLRKEEENRERKKISFYLSYIAGFYETSNFPLLSFILFTVDDRRIRVNPLHGRKSH